MTQDTCRNPTGNMNGMDLCKVLQQPEDMPTGCKSVM